MTTVVRFSDHRRKPPYLHFTRAELNQLLGLYAGRVRNGEWRDYAIQLGPEAASFMVFRHTQENPLFVISKLGASRPRARPQNVRQGQYVVVSRQQKLCQGHSLDDVLGVFDRPMKLVTG
ncbi:MAG: DUF2794 domain-containing protein [Rhodospirillaceae bacterium]|nr:DUF2794 domain-containing protein [Rhodospirillaceae bacterium]